MNNKPMYERNLTAHSVPVFGCGDSGFADAQSGVKHPFQFSGGTDLFADALNGARITRTGSHADISALQSVTSRNSSQERLSLIHLVVD